MHREEPNTGILYSHEKYRQEQNRLTEQMSLIHKLTKAIYVVRIPKSLAHSRLFSILLSNAEPVCAFQHTEISEILYEKCYQ